jgi:hypothetical protein
MWRKSKDKKEPGKPKEKEPKVKKPPTAKQEQTLRGFIDKNKEG